MSFAARFISFGLRISQPNGCTGLSCVLVGFPSTRDLFLISTFIALISPSPFSLSPVLW